MSKKTTETIEVTPDTPDTLGVTLHFPTDCLAWLRATVNEARFGFVTAAEADAAVALIAQIDAYAK